MKEQLKRCKYCGGHYRPKSHVHTLTCSRECGQSLRRLREFDYRVRQGTDMAPGFLLQEEI